MWRMVETFGTLDRRIGRPVTDLELTHGPALLRQMLELGEAEAEDLGVTLELATPEELVAVNQINKESWPPLVPIFDREQAGYEPEDCIVIFGRNDTGEVVLTQAVRRTDLTGTSVRSELESLRLLYKDPAKQRGPDESIEVTAPAGLITGKAAYTGGHWVRPDFRRKLDELDKSKFTGISPRMARAMAIGFWDIDYAYTLMGEHVYNKGVAERAGYRNAEEWVYMKNSPVWPNMTVKAYLLWNDRSEIEKDLQNYLESLKSQK